MSRRLVLWMLLALCAVCVAASFFMAWRTPSTDFGFTAGLNRVGVFFRWQGAGALLALVAWVYAGGFAKGSVERRLGRLPIWIFIAEIAALGALILYLNVTKPPAAPSSAPQVAPQAAPLTPTEIPSQ